ncbi:Hypothetical protein c0828 [Escherichia coli CFT073]|uniref:Uncharacterized protein n=1 Tax=Escherichia coli O6:H1 (strain CFT073 / ATCC 700928 / UPEC) TaxID=199310 RepID=A0A0H2V5E0_ECOL6|nr:Hypothetical protein c0828 [Escherichia coli CFT073]
MAISQGYCVVPSVLVSTSLLMPSPVWTFLLISGQRPSLHMVFLCSSSLVMPSLFIEEPSGCSIVPPEPVFTPLLSTLFGATFSRASGATWPASAAAFAWPLLLCAPLSAASAAPLARLRVAVKNSVASFVIFIGCSCYGRYVG